MFSLTSYERKALLFIGAILLLGAVIRISKINFSPVKGEEVGYETKININKATLNELMKIPSIGEKIATEIINYRQKNGMFKCLDELKKIKGIGEKKVLLIKDYVSF